MKFKTIVTKSFYIYNGIATLRFIAGTEILVHPTKDKNRLRFQHGQLTGEISTAFLKEKCQPCIHRTDDEILGEQNRVESFVF